jgi:hypothetical protein
MGVLTSEVGYTSTTTGRGDHEVHKGHVMALAKKKCERWKRSDYEQLNLEREKAK